MPSAYVIEPRSTIIPRRGQKSSTGSSCSVARRRSELHETKSKDEMGWTQSGRNVTGTNTAPRR